MTIKCDCGTCEYILIKPSADINAHTKKANINQRQFSILWSTFCGFQTSHCYEDSQIKKYRNSCKLRQTAFCFLWNFHNKCGNASVEYFPIQQLWKLIKSLNWHIENLLHYFEDAFRRVCKDLPRYRGEVIIWLIARDFRRWFIVVVYCGVFSVKPNLL